MANGLKVGDRVRAKEAYLKRLNPDMRKRVSGTLIIFAAEPKIFASVDGTRWSDGIVCRESDVYKV